MISIPGLNQRVGNLRADAAAHAQQARDPNTEPRDAHRYAERADRHAAEADQLMAQVDDNAQVVEGIEHLIHYLTNSTIQSPSRTLAMRELENASMRLRRECGDAPAN